MIIYMNEEAFSLVKRILFKLTSKNADRNIPLNESSL
jgi:hypothetical protein